MAYGLLFHSGEAESGDSDEEVSIGGQDEDADSVEASQRLHGLDEVANLHHVPSDKAISAWNGLLAFKKKATSAKAKAFGPPIAKALKYWGNEEDAPNFRLPEDDECLMSFFGDARKKDKLVFEAASTAASTAGASANALLAANEKTSDIIENLQSVILPFLDDESQEHDAIVGIINDLQDSVKKPIEDAVRIQANVFGKAVTEVRKSVIAQANDSLQGLLKRFPPKENRFFGNPSEILHQDISVNLGIAAMRKATASSSFSSSKKRYDNRQKSYAKNFSASSSSSSASTSRAASSSKSATSSSASSADKKAERGNFRGRGRGGKSK